jgi:hypothetical protein
MLQLERVSEEARDNMQGINRNVTEILRLLRRETHSRTHSKKSMGASSVACSKVNNSPRLEASPFAAESFLAGASVPLDSLQTTREQTAETTAGAMLMTEHATQRQATPALAGWQAAGPEATPGAAQYRLLQEKSQGPSEATPSSVSTTSKSLSMHFAHGPPARVAYEPSLDQVQAAGNTQLTGREYKKAGSSTSSASYKQIRMSEEESTWAVRTIPIPAALTAPSLSSQLGEDIPPATLVPKLNTTRSTTGINQSRTGLPQSLATQGVMVQVALSTADNTLRKERKSSAATPPSGWQLTSELVLADPAEVHLAESTLPLLRSPQPATRQTLQPANQLRGGRTLDLQRSHVDGNGQSRREITRREVGADGVQVDASPAPYFLPSSLSPIVTITVALLIFFEKK